MEETLQSLYTLQGMALDKKIDFDLDLHYSGQKDPVLDVRMSFTSTGTIAEARSLYTSFSNSMTSTLKKQRLDRIDHFIKTTVC